MGNRGPSPATAPTTMPCVPVAAQGASMTPPLSVCYSPRRRRRTPSLLSLSVVGHAMPVRGESDPNAGKRMRDRGEGRRRDLPWAPSMS